MLDGLDVIGVEMLTGLVFPGWVLVGMSSPHDSEFSGKVETVSCAGSLALDDVTGSPDEASISLSISLSIEDTFCTARNLLRFP